MKISTTSKVVNIVKKYIIPSIVVVGFCYILALIAGNKLIFPMPHSVVYKMFLLLGLGKTYLSILLSAVRIMSGLIIGFAIGFLLAYLSFKYEYIKYITKPFVNISKGVPIVAITLLLLMWISGRNISIILVALVAFPLIFENVFLSLNGIDNKYVELIEIFKLDNKTCFKYIEYPLIKKNLIGSMEFLVMFAWKAGISGEILSQPKYSMGSLIYDAKTYIEVEEMYAYVVLVLIISYLIKLLITQGLRRKYDKH